MKKRTLNEYRQTKEYQGSEEGRKYLLSDQGGDYTVPHKGAEPKAYKDIAGDPDLMESVKKMIADKVVKHLDDVIFEMVSEGMRQNYIFRSNNYLTEAGYELFEDQWFEFYHEHHGDILAQIHNKLIY